MNRFRNGGRLISIERYSSGTHIHIPILVKVFVYTWFGLITAALAKAVL